VKRKNDRKFLSYFGQTIEMSQRENTGSALQL